jgi:hypothetical protein
MPGIYVQQLRLQWWFSQTGEIAFLRDGPLCLPVVGFRAIPLKL